MKSLAVIGSGIAGMASAYLLRNVFDVTLYEKNNYIGGHTNTVDVSEDGRPVPIDTGFMVYNDRTYPNLIRFFEHLGIQAMDTDMSFGVNDVASGFATSYSDLSTFFPRWTDYLSPDRYRLLIGMKELFKEGKIFIEDGAAAALTLAEFIRLKEISPIVVEKFLLPMTAAIWSTPTDRMLDYPAHTLFRFLSNHGMLGFSDQFQWKTLVGGSRQYKTKVLAALEGRVQQHRKCAALIRNPEGVRVVDDRGVSQSHDLAIVATHADQALRLIDQPTPTEQELLSSFYYNINPVVLHSDSSVMPPHRKTWASWNYRFEPRGERAAGSTHYWMNRLQKVSEKTDYFVSVDYDGPIDPSKVHWRHTYEHPRFDLAAIEAQPRLGELNADGPVYFCGSYFRYGFHEDAYTSALNLATQLNGGVDPLS